LPLTQIITLAVVQGITEFLPISSSAHLILVPKLADWPDQGLLIDVAAHLGTLMAVILYCIKDLILMAVATLQHFRRYSNKNVDNPHYQLVVKLVIATVPILLAGYFFNKFLGDSFRSIEIIGWATICFGLLLFFADKSNMTIREINHITFKGALLIGLFQILALIPGTSRAGITMTAARFQGVERRDAARFSLLLSIPVIVSAGGLKSFDLYMDGDAILMREALIIMVISFCVAMTAISLMMFWLKNSSFTPFVIYRIALGISLLLIFYIFPDFQLP